MADKQTAADKLGVHAPSGTSDPDIDDKYDELDPTKVVGTYAEQPDPNASKPAPGPNVPKGVKKAPASDDPDAGAIGEGK